MWEMYHNDTPYDMQDDNYIPNPQFGRFSQTAPLNYALLAISCLSAQPEDRPSFVQVIEFLAAIGLELASGYYSNMNGVTEVLPPPCLLSVVTGASVFSWLLHPCLMQPARG